MTIEETPVRRRLDLSEEVYFFNPQNRDRVNGNRTSLQVESDSYIDATVSIGIFFTLVTGATLSMFLQHLLWLILPFFAIVAAALWYYLPQLANQRVTNRLQRGGEFLEGEIVSCVGGVATMGISKHPQFQVTTTFTFRTPAGTKLKGVDTQLRPMLNHKPLPLPGTPVVVLYFNDNDLYLL